MTSSSWDNPVPWGSIRPNSVQILRFLRSEHRERTWPKEALWDVETRPVWAFLTASLVRPPPGNIQSHDKISLPFYTSLQNYAWIFLRRNCTDASRARLPIIRTGSPWLKTWMCSCLLFLYIYKCQFIISCLEPFSNSRSLSRTMRFQALSPIANGIFFSEFPQNHLKRPDWGSNAYAHQHLLKSLFSPSIIQN